MKHKCPTTPAKIAGCSPDLQNQKLDEATQLKLLQFARMWKAVLYFYNPRFVMGQRVVL